MMPTLAYPRPERAARGGGRGFTLLEMAVSLAVLALAAALVAPSISRMADGWRNESELREFRQRLRSLPTLARQLGRETRVGGSGEADRVVVEALALPEGWRLELAPALVIQSNGVCRGAKGRLHTLAADLDLEIQAPFCEPIFEAVP